MTSATVPTTRRVLCDFPLDEPSFGTFDHAYHLAGTKTFMPPLGLLIIAANLQPHAEVRSIDENPGVAADADIKRFEFSRADLAGA